MRSGWDFQAARAAGAELHRAALAPDGEDIATLRPRFLTTLVFDGDAHSAAFQASVHLPRFSGLPPVHGGCASTKRGARELAALAAVQLLYENGALDEHLMPVTDGRLAQDADSAEAVDWLQTRHIGDHVLESGWTSLQTWRKPPDMRLRESGALALDVRAAAAYTAADDGKGDSPMAGTDVEGDLKEFWIYAIQFLPEGKSPGGFA